MSLSSTLIPTLNLILIKRIIVQLRRRTVPNIVVRRLPLLSRPVRNRLIRIQPIRCESRFPLLAWHDLLRPPSRLMCVRDRSGIAGGSSNGSLLLLRWLRLQGEGRVLAGTRTEDRLALPPREVVARARRGCRSGRTLNRRKRLLRRSIPDGNGNIEAWLVVSTRPGMRIRVRFDIAGERQVSPRSRAHDRLSEGGGEGHWWEDWSHGRCTI